MPPSPPPILSPFDDETPAARWQRNQSEKQQRRVLGILTCLNTNAARSGHVRADLFHQATLNGMKAARLVELYSRPEHNDFLTYVRLTLSGERYLKENTNHVR